MQNRLNDVKFQKGLQTFWGFGDGIGSMLKQMLPGRFFDCKLVREMIFTPNAFLMLPRSF
jgi:hypothetical protein